MRDSPGKADKLKVHEGVGSCARKRLSVTQVRIPAHPNFMGWVRTSVRLPYANATFFEPLELGEAILAERVEHLLDRIIPAHPNFMGRDENFSSTTSAEALPSSKLYS